MLRLLKTLLYASVVKSLGIRPTMPFAMAFFPLKEVATMLTIGSSVKAMTRMHTRIITI